MPIHSEKTFETAVVEILCKTSWIEGNSADYSVELALDKKTVLGFILNSLSEE